MTADPGRSGGEGTGWHIHKRPKSVCLDAACHWPEFDKRDIAPVIVLDPVTARDTIARAAAEARDCSFDFTASPAVANCDFRWSPDTREVVMAHYAHHILAALASQERGE